MIITTENQREYDEVIKRFKKHITCAYLAYPFTEGKETYVFHITEGWMA